MKANPARPQQILYSIPIIWCLLYKTFPIGHRLLIRLFVGRYALGHVPSSNRHPHTTKHSTSGNRQQSCQMSILSYSTLPNEPAQPNPAFANRTRRSTQSCCETSRRPVKDISGIWNSWNFPVIHAKGQNAFSKQYCIYWRPTFKSMIFRYLLRTSIVAPLISLHESLHELSIYHSSPCQPLSPQVPQK